MPCPEKFRESLVKFGIKKSVCEKINKGFETVVSRSPKKEKAAYFKHAMDCLEEAVDWKTMCQLLEWNACCTSGMRDKASKQFARVNAGLSLEEKLSKIETVPYMGKAKLNEEGTLILYAVSYSDGEKYLCSCSNFNKLKSYEPVSKNYCLCCAGHFKYHYEIMLGVKLKTLEIVSSPIDSEGQNPCVMKYQIIENED